MPSIKGSKKIDLLGALFRQKVRKTHKNVAALPDPDPVTECACSSGSWRAFTHLEPAITESWTSDDLCSQCLANHPEQLRDQAGRRTRFIRSIVDSICPLCRFDVATVSLMTPEVANVDAINYRLVAIPITAMFTPIGHIKDELYSPSQSLADHTVLRFEAHADTVSFKRRAGDIGLGRVFDASTDPPKPAISLRKLHPSKIDYTTLRDWLVHCQTHHKDRCNSLSPTLTGKTPVLRLIDCRTRVICDVNDDFSFVALSYVWGTSHHKQSIFMPINGSPLPDSTPQTIIDAMEVVIGLDLVYLWVDRYCINQSDEAEVQSQVSVMDLIYDRATVTIIAASGTDPDFGLPGVGCRARIPQPVIKLDGRLWVSGMRDPVRLVTNSTWWTRGWTFQEGIFSRRRLYFTEEQVYFECNSQASHESLILDLHALSENSHVPWSTSFLAGGSFNNELSGLDGFIKEYSHRQLGVPGDVLKAFLGVLRAFDSHPYRIQHFWGIPIDANKFQVEMMFAYALCWVPDGPSLRRPNFPSWSWTGWMGPLQSLGIRRSDNGRQDEPPVTICIGNIDGSYERLTKALVDDLDVAHAAAKGRIPRLRVETYTMQVKFRYSADGWSGEIGGQLSHVKYMATIPSKEAQEDPLYSPLVLTTDVDEGGEVHKMLCHQSVTCILLPNDFALVIMKKGDAWERVGSVNMEDNKRRRKVIDHCQYTTQVFELI